MNAGLSENNRFAILLVITVKRHCEQFPFTGTERAAKKVSAVWRPIHGIHVFFGRGEQQVHFIVRNGYHVEVIPLDEPVLIESNKLAIWSPDGIPFKEGVVC